MNNLSKKGSTFFLKDMRWRRYIYHFDGGIQIAEDGPEEFAFEAIPGKKDTYYIIYKGRDNFWKPRPKYGEYLWAYQMNPTDKPDQPYYRLKPQPSEFEIKHISGDVYSFANQKGQGQGFFGMLPGFTGTWEITMARDETSITPTPIELPNVTQGVSLMGFDHHEDIEFGKIGNDNPQQPKMHFNMNVIASKFQNNKTRLMVSIDGTQISANKGTIDLSSYNSKKIEWFLDYVEVLITVKDENGNIFRSDGHKPETQMKNGSVNYFESQTLGVSVGVEAGVDKTGPSAGVNTSLSYSETWGSSVTYELSDFSFVVPGIEPLRHEYQMARMTGGNGEYRMPSDMIIDKNRVGGLTDFARGFFKVLSSGIFEAKTDTKQAKVKVEVRFNLGSASVEDKPTSGYSSFEAVREFDVDLTTLNG